MKHSVMAPCITAFVFLFVIALCLSWQRVALYSKYDVKAENTLIKQVNMDNDWAISYQQALRKGRYSQIDASDSFLYLAYSRNSCVDVYNYHGEFQYAILLPNCQNGTVQIRCVDNYIVISDKNNTVYVLDGIEEIARMEYDQAARKGYDYFWFEEKKSRQHIDGDFYVETDISGNVVKKIMCPRPNGSISMSLIAVIAIAGLVHILCFLWYLFIKNRLPH